MGKKQAKGSRIGDELVEALHELKACLESGQKLEDRFIVRKVLADIKPPEFSAAKVRAIRKRMGMSQAFFAQVLAVSAKTVELWEREGAKTPMARRLLETIEPWWASVGPKQQEPPVAKPKARRRGAA